MINSVQFIGNNHLSFQVHNLFVVFQVYTSLAMCKVIVVVVPVIVGTFAVFGKLQRKYTLMMQEAVAGANQVATERLSSVRTVRMLVAEKKELAAYSDKINDIWLISKKEGFAKGCMFGSVSNRKNIGKKIMRFSVPIYRIFGIILDSFLWKQSDQSRTPHLW